MVRSKRFPILLMTLLVLAAPAGATLLDVEKDELKFGFIKLTDCAALVIAKEKGFFEEEGLFVTLEAQANWKILLDRVISGELDGAHKLAGQPIGATIGIGTQAEVITPFSMDLNGNGITVSNEIWKQMKANDPSLQKPEPVHPISAKGLVPVVQEHKDLGTPLRMGMVFPVSTHNYELRYWLAASGISPGFYTRNDTTGQTDADVLLSDRVTMMTNGPRARVGDILSIRFERPRERASLMETDEYYELREHLISFLEGQELERGLLDSAA